MSFSYVGDFFRKMEPISLLVTTLSCTLLICNLVGNVLVMLVICKNKKQSVSANAFLLSSLACSDLELAIVIFFYTIFLTYRVTQGNFPDFIFHALISVYTLVALAVERYYAILKPFVHLTRMVKSLVKKVVVAVWIFAAFMSSPGYVFETGHGVNKGQNVTRFNETREAATWFETLRTVYASLVLLFGLILPATIMVFCYSRVIYHVWFNTDATKLTNTALLLSRRKLTKLFIIVTVVFIITWTPTFVRNIVTSYMDLKSAWIYDLSSMFLGLLGSSANPVIYSFRCPKFRQEVTKILACRFCKRKRQPNVAFLRATNRYSPAHMRRKMTTRPTTLTVEPVSVITTN